MQSTGVPQTTHGAAASAGAPRNALGTRAEPAESVADPPRLQPKTETSPRFPGFVPMPASEMLQLIASSWRSAAASVAESLPWKEAPRLLAQPLFFVLLLLFFTAAILRVVASLLWAVTAPLLLRNCDFVTWLVSTDPQYFRGKVVWITGGSSGLGLNLAKHIAALGCGGLILTSRRKSDLEKAREEIIYFCKQRSVFISAEDFLLLPFDLSVAVNPSDAESEGEERWSSLVRDALEWKGAVDILINNAGRIAAGSLPSTSVQLSLMELNFGSCVKLTNLLLPHLQSRPNGHVVFTNSSSALYNFGGFNAYSTTKVALLNFSRILRQDLRGNSSRVSVTSMHPGYVPTNIFKNIFDEQVKDLNEPKAHKSVEVEGFSGLDPEVAAKLTVRAISRRLEESWIGSPLALLSMYFAFYCPELLLLSRKVTARLECEHIDGGRATVLKALRNLEKKTVS